MNSGDNSWRHLAQEALELCCNKFRVHTLDSPLRPTCLVFRVRGEPVQLGLFLRAPSTQQYRQGRRLFLLSALGHAATTKVQWATAAAFQCGIVGHTTKVSTPDWPVSRRFIFQHRLLASRLNRSLCLATCSTKVTTKMVKLNFIVYFVGVVAFAIVYEPVKQSLGGGLLFFILAIAYLISLRALGYLLTNKFNQPEGVNKK